MKIGIYYNAKQVERTVAETLSEEISALGGNAYVADAIEGLFGCDRAVVLGGDGTVLHVVRAVAEKNIPIFAVNYGTLGFLTEFERGEISKAAKLAVDPSCPVIERTMLEVDLNGVKSYCLNELSILCGVSKDHNLRAEHFSVMIDGSCAGKFHADGLIVSTPTGSTGYSLSAGGSVMTPGCNTFLLTPVCAFSLKSRPISYPDHCTLEFLFPENRMVLCGDGIFLGEAGKNDRLTVRKAARYASFLTASSNEYFRRLIEKIN